MKLPDLDLSAKTREALATLFPDGGPDIPEVVLGMQEIIVMDALTDPVNTLIAAFQAHAELVAGETAHHEHIQHLVKVLATEAALIEHTWRTKFETFEQGEETIDGQLGHMLKIRRKAA